VRCGFRVSVKWRSLGVIGNSRSHIFTNSEMATSIIVDVRCQNGPMDNYDSTLPHHPIIFIFSFLF
jgi:hypothetical protein